MPKCTPVLVGSVGFLVPVHDPVAPAILPAAALVVDDERALPAIDPLVADMFPFVAGLFRDEMIDQLVVEVCPTVMIVPFVIVLPAADIPNC